jgi:glucokinase
LLAIGVDVGGTKIAAGLVDESGSVRTVLRRSTPRGAVEALGAIGELVDQLVVIAQSLRDPGVVASPSGAGLPVGIGVAGFVASDAATVRLAPNLGWRDRPLGAELAAVLGVPVRVENDANAAAWAEARFGAAVGRGSALCVTVGTGVGGGIVTGGQLWRGGFGMAGELGHLQVVAAGRECGCGQRGCLEQYASGNALVRLGQELVAGRHPSSGALREACGDRPDALTGPMIADLAAAGDTAAIRLIEEIGRWLGVGLAGLAAVLDPECFVIGGGVASVGELLLSAVRESFVDRLPAGRDRPIAQVLAASLGNDAGLVGAADLARPGVGAT